MSFSTLTPQASGAFSSVWQAKRLAGRGTTKLKSWMPFARANGWGRRRLAGASPCRMRVLREILRRSPSSRGCGARSISRRAMRNRWILSSLSCGPRLRSKASFRPFRTPAARSGNLRCSGTCAPPKRRKTWWRSWAARLRRRRDAARRRSGARSANRILTRRDARYAASPHPGGPAFRRRYRGRAAADPCPEHGSGPCGQRRTRRPADGVGRLPDRLGRRRAAGRVRLDAEPRAQPDAPPRRLRLALRRASDGHRRARGALCPLLHGRGRSGAALLRLPARLHGRDDGGGGVGQPSAAGLLLGADEPLLLPADRLLAPYCLGARWRPDGAYRHCYRWARPFRRRAGARPHRRQLRTRCGAGRG